MEAKLSRRDMIVIEKTAGEPFSKLFPDGEATALGTLAAQYVLDQKSGATDKTFDVWLEEDAADVEVEEENPT